MKSSSTAQLAPSSGAKPFTLSAALAVLLRVAALAVFNDLQRGADLAALGAVYGDKLGGRWGNWGTVFRVLRDAQERLEEVGPLSSRQARATDDEVLEALLRSEASDAADALLVEIGERFVSGSWGPNTSRQVAAELLPDLAVWLHGHRRSGIDSRRRVGPYEASEVLEAWCCVHGALHQCPGGGQEVDAGDGVALCPVCLECWSSLGDTATIPAHTRAPSDLRPTDPAEPPPETLPSVPELVVELPALVAGEEGLRALAPVVALLHRVLACHAEVVARGRGLSLRFSVPLDVPRLLRELDAERRRADRLELAAKGGEP